MITYKNLVPDIYYNRSRDFQILGAYYDLIFNYMKQNADLVSTGLTEDVDDELVDLIITDLGFKESHSYNIRQLKKLISIFSLAIKNKGNIESISLIVDMLNNIAGLTTKAYIAISDEDPYKIYIYTPSILDDTILLEDMINYILPAGMTYAIRRQSLINYIGVSNIGLGDFKTSWEGYSEYQTSAVFKLDKDSDLPSLQNQGLISTVVGISDSEDASKLYEIYKAKDTVNNNQGD